MCVANYKFSTVHDLKTKLTFINMVHLYLGCNM